jgi:hypothetical protein
LEWLGKCLHVGEAVVLPLMGYRILSPQAAKNVDAFNYPAYPLFGADAHSLQFLGKLETVPRGTSVADSKNGAPTG